MQITEATILDKQIVHSTLYKLWNDGHIDTEVCLLVSIRKAVFLFGEQREWHALNVSCVVYLKDNLTVFTIYYFTIPDQWPVLALQMHRGFMIYCVTFIINLHTCIVA